jgi:hypothetical protein
VEFLPDSGHAVSRESGETMSRRPLFRPTGQRGRCTPVTGPAGRLGWRVLRANSGHHIDVPESSYVAGPQPVTRLTPDTIEKGERPQ